MLANIVDVLIDFVGDDHHVGMTLKHRGDGLQLVIGIDGTTGVAGRADDDEACLVGHDGLEFLGCHLEVLLHARGQQDVLAAGEVDHLHVTYPCRGRDDDLITGVDERHDGIAQLVLGTIADDNLVGGVLQAILAAQFLAYCLTQRQVAGNGRIEREVVVDGLTGSSLDVVGGEEVGFAHREVNHIHALSAQLAALL